MKDFLWIGSADVGRKSRQRSDFGFRPRIDEAEPFLQSWNWPRVILAWLCCIGKGARSLRNGDYGQVPDGLYGWTDSTVYGCVMGGGRQWFRRPF